MRPPIWDHIRPTWPQSVQTMLSASDLMGMLSGRWAMFMAVL